MERREYKRISYKRRGGTMRVIAPGDKRRQVACGVGVYEERRCFREANRQ